jgi:hypothetical protein
MRMSRPTFLLALGVAAEIALVLGIPLSGMVDGGLHLNGATTLRDAVFGLEPLDAAYLEWFPVPVPNLLPELLLAALTKIVAPGWAERALILGYVVALPLAMVYAVRSVRRDADWLALVALPLTFSFSLHYGFYNFCFSVVMFLVTAGYAVRCFPALNKGRVAALGLLLTVTYLTHIVGFVEALLFVAILSTFRLGLDPARRNRLWLPATIIVIGAVALLAFLAGTDSLRPSGFDSKPREIKETLALTWGLKTYSSLELIPILILATLLLGLLVTITVYRRPLLRWRQGDDVLVFTMIAFLAIVVAPAGIESGGSFVTQRLALFPILGFVLWTASQPIPQRWLCLVGVGFIVVAAALAAIRLPVYEDLRRAVDDFMTSTPCIAENSTMIQATLALPHIETGRIDPLSGETSRVAAETAGLDLGNVEWSVPYYVLRFREDRDPYNKIPRIPGAIEAIPPSFDLRGYEKRTGGRVDYVLVTGRRFATSEVVHSPEWRDLRAQLGAMYRVVHRSPGGWVETWERRVPEVEEAGSRRRAVTGCPSPA